MLTLAAGHLMTFDLVVTACRMTAMHYCVYTKFDVDSLSLFQFAVQMDTCVTAATDHPTYGCATTVMDKFR